MGRTKLSQNQFFPKTSTASSDSEFDSSTYAMPAMSSGTLSYPENDSEFGESDSGDEAKPKQKAKKKKQKNKSTKKKKRKRKSKKRDQASPPRARKKSVPGEKKKKNPRGRPPKVKKVEGDLPGTYKPASPPMSTSGGQIPNGMNISDIMKINGGAIDPRSENKRSYIEMNASEDKENMRKPPSTRGRPPRHHVHSSDTVVAASRPPHGYQPRHRLHSQLSKYSQPQSRKRTAPPSSKKSHKRRKLTSEQAKKLTKLKNEHLRWEERRRKTYRKKAKIMKEKHIPMPSPAYEPLYDILECLRTKYREQLETALTKLYRDCENKGEEGQSEDNIDEFRIKILNWIFAGYLAEGAAWLRSHRGVRSLAILYALIDFAEEKQLSDVLLREEDLLKPMIKLIARVLYSLDKEVMNMVVSYLVSKNSTLTSVLTNRISALLGEKENGVILENLPFLYIGNEEKTKPNSFLGPRRCVETPEPMLYDDIQKYDDIANMSPGIHPMFNTQSIPYNTNSQRKTAREKRRQRSDESASSDEGPEYFPPPFARHMTEPAFTTTPTPKKSLSTELDSKGIYRSFCGKHFATYRGFKQHSRKNFECQACLEAQKEGSRPSFHALCGIVFEEPVDLRNHNKGDKRCDECARIFHASGNKVDLKKLERQSGRTKRTNTRTENRGSGTLSPAGSSNWKRSTPSTPSSSENKENVVFPPT